MKQLTLIPVGGLANRIYTIASAIGFFADNDIRLKVFWFKDWGMGAGFYDLFSLSPSVEHVEIKDANFADFFKYAKPIKSNFFLPAIFQKFKYDSIYSWKEYSKSIPVEEWYLSHKYAQNAYLLYGGKFYNNICLDILFPKNSIQERIDERLKLLSSNTIGIHIRRTDLSTITKVSPLSGFVKKMQQEIESNPETNFYVASDSPEEKKQLTDRFGFRIITVENTLRRDTKDGITDALVELYTLASTKKIYGSFYSSYSTLASEIKGIPLEIMIEATESK
jgi:hypothetical protein